MAKATTKEVPATDRFPDFSAEQVGTAVQIAAKLALLSERSLLFVDGFVTGAIMAQQKDDGQQSA